MLHGAQRRRNKHAFRSAGALLARVQCKRVCRWGEARHARRRLRRAHRQRAARLQCKPARCTPAPATSSGARARCKRACNANELGGARPRARRAGALLLTTPARCALTMQRGSTFDRTRRLYRTTGALLARVQCKRVSRWGRGATRSPAAAARTPPARCALTMQARALRARTQQSPRSAGALQARMQCKRVRCSGSGACACKRDGCHLASALRARNAARRAPHAHETELQ